MVDEKIFTHESYGIVSFNRITGGSRRLFGSVLPGHSETIRFTVSRGERHHSLSRDWFFPRKNLIEVELSPAQFAELITTMNMGAGVPCTIKYLDGKTVEEPPMTDIEQEEIRTGFGEEMKKLGNSLIELSNTVTEVISASRLSKQDREKILNGVAGLIQEVKSNLPFVETSFREATEKVVMAAKAEFEAFMVHSIARAGLTALNGKTINALTDGTNND